MNRDFTNNVLKGGSYASNYYKLYVYSRISNVGRNNPDDNKGFRLCLKL